eukprot:122051_1
MEVDIFALLFTANASRQINENYSNQMLPFFDCEDCSVDIFGGYNWFNQIYTKSFQKQSQTPYIPIANGGITQFRFHYNNNRTFLDLQNTTNNFTMDNTAEYIQESITNDVQFIVYDGYYLDTQTIAFHPFNPSSPSSIHRGTRNTHTNSSQNNLTWPFERCSDAFVFGFGIITSVHEWNLSTKTLWPDTATVWRNSQSYEKINLYEWIGEYSITDIVNQTATNDTHSYRVLSVFFGYYESIYSFEHVQGTWYSSFVTARLNARLQTPSEPYYEDTPDKLLARFTSITSACGYEGYCDLTLPWQIRPDIMNESMCLIPTSSPAPPPVFCCDHDVIVNGTSCGSSCFTDLDHCDNGQDCAVFSVSVTNSGSLSVSCGKGQTDCGSHFLLQEQSNATVGCNGWCQGMNFVVQSGSYLNMGCGGFYSNGNVDSCEGNIYFIKDSTLWLRCTYYGSCANVIIMSYNSQITIDCSKDTCQSMQQLEFCESNNEMYLCSFPSGINNIFQVTWFNFILWMALLIGIGSSVSSCYFKVRSTLNTTDQTVSDINHETTNDIDDIDISMTNDRSHRTVNDTTEALIKHKQTIRGLDLGCFVGTSIFEIYCFVKLGESINDLFDYGALDSCLSGTDLTFASTYLNSKLLSLAGIEWTVMCIFWCVFMTHTGEYPSKWFVHNEKHIYRIRAMFETLFFISGLAIYYGLWIRIFSDPLSPEWNDYVAGVTRESWCYHNEETAQWYAVKVTSDTIHQYIQNIYLFGTGIQLFVDVFVVLIFF